MGAADPADYKALWRFTVEYLRDEKGIHHLLYAYSPDYVQDREEYLSYYPGDAYVDVLGYDNYGTLTDGYNRLRRIDTVAVDSPAALEAWTWTRRHPAVSYNQRDLNASFEPDITTGAYGDRRFADEFAWAAAELSVTTGADSFLVAHSPIDLELGGPSWPTVGALGWYTLLEPRGEVASAIDTAQLKRRYPAFADRLVHGRRDVPYWTVMGHSERDFRWGSNDVAGNQAMALLQAYRLSGDTKYREAALAIVDYLLGRNATGYSFLTGVGNRTPMHIHHRPAEADTVRAPVPGLLAGGPNPGQQDRENCRAAVVDYPSDRPASPTWITFVVTRRTR